MKYPISIAVVFLWIGFVCAISFMEAWLKFRAPGISLPLGLSIGRLVFNALNKVEWILALIILAEILLSKGKAITSTQVFYVIPLLILVIQTVWLLPILDERAEMHIDGQTVASSHMHYYYVGAEVVKVALLLIYGIKLFRTQLIT